MQKERKSKARETNNEIGTRERERERERGREISAQKSGRVERKRIT